MPGEVAQISRSTPLRQVATVRELLSNAGASKQIAMVAADHINAERQLRLISGALRTTPKLGECTPLSLLGCLMTTAALGLEPNTPLGHAYLIPRWNGRTESTECTLQIGYKGYTEMAMRHPSVVSIHADVVYDDDEFSFEYGSNRHLRHKPGAGAGEITHAYCFVTLTDGDAFLVWPIEKVRAHRDRYSDAYKNAERSWKGKPPRRDSPWHTNEPEMAMKTLIRAIFQRGRAPMSVQMAKALEVEDRRANYSEVALEREPDIELDLQPDAQDAVIEPDLPEGAPAGSEPEAPVEPKAASKAKAPVATAAEADAPEIPATKQLERAEQIASAIRSELVDVGGLSTPVLRADGVSAVRDMFVEDLAWLRRHAPAVRDEVETALVEAGK